MMVRITTPNACFGLMIKNNEVVFAPPIANWTIGKPWGYVREYYKARGFEIEITRIG